MRLLITKGKYMLVSFHYTEIFFHFLKGFSSEVVIHLVGGLKDTKRQKEQSKS